MKKSNNQYILTPWELASLCQAAIEPAAKRLNAPDYDPRHDSLPRVVQNAYRLLYHKDLFSDLQNRFKE